MTVFFPYDAFEYIFYRYLHLSSFEIIKLLLLFIQNISPILIG